MSYTFTKPFFLFLIFTLIWVMSLIGDPIARCEVKDPSDEGPPVMKAGWSSYIRGGALHQFDADMDDGSRFSVNRYFIQGGLTYALDMRRSISVALGYGLDSYDFSGDGGFAAINPWENVHTMRLSMPVRWRIDSN